jgi:alkylation response protein AidB-like acyl-CoA dehydrogenase
VIIDGPVADICIVSADGGLTAYPLLPERLPAAPGMDLSRRLVESWASFDGPGVRIGRKEDCERLLDRAWLMLAADMPGASEEMLSVATEDTKVRELFGRPIDSFHAVQHRLCRHAH